MSGDNSWEGELLSSGKGFKKQKEKIESSQGEISSDQDKNSEFGQLPIRESILE